MREYYNTGILTIAFFVAFGLTVACLLLNSVAQGISLDQLVNNLNESAAEYAGRRYGYDIAPNAYQQIGNVLAYFCAGLGGLIFLSYKGRWLRLLIVVSSLFPAIFVMLSQSARGMLFSVCCNFFMAGF